MDLFATLLIGVLLGGLYGAIGLGLSLSFGIMRLINLAHGDLIVLSAYFCLALVGAAPVSPLAGMLVVLPIMFAVGLALQRAVIGRTLGQGVLPPLMVTFGLSVILQNVLLLVFTPDARTLPSPLAAARLEVTSWLALPAVYVVDCAAAWVVLGLLTLLLSRTALGRALRATSDDPEVAQLLGIDPRRVHAVAAALATALAGVAGILLGTTFTFYPSTGPSTLLVAFEAVVIGGLGSLTGTLLGGTLLGVAQLLGGHLYGPSAALIAGHAVFLAVLLLRPQGLFPRTAL